MLAVILLIYLLRNVFVTFPILTIFFLYFTKLYFASKKLFYLKDIIHSKEALLTPKNIIL